jgi:hypothetical protein
MQAFAFEDRKELVEPQRNKNGHQEPAEPVYKDGQGHNRKKRDGTYEPFPEHLLLLVYPAEAAFPLLVHPYRLQEVFLPEIRPILL